MFSPPSTAKDDAAAFGLRIEDDDDADDTPWIYEPNRQTVEVMALMRTQWRVGFNGITGLDYAALPPVYAALGVRKRDRPTIFHGLRVMENEVLKLLAENKDHGKPSAN